MKKQSSHICHLQYLIYLHYLPNELVMDLTCLCCPKLMYLCCIYKIKCYFLSVHCEFKTWF